VKHDLPDAHDSFAPNGNWLHAIVRAGALAGGAVFLVMTAMLVVTIVSRKLFAWQVPGDVELVQMGAAFAAAPFFAWCHLVRGEVKVDFATNHLPKKWIAGLDALGSVLVGLFGSVLAWRTAVLAIGTVKGGEMSAILGWPVWVAQALMVPGLALLGLVGFYEAFRTLRSAAKAAAKQEIGAATITGDGGTR
jgi:TRAP-type C4-dicarboxylate transport system permease small subunit